MSAGQAHRCICSSVLPAPLPAGLEAWYGLRLCGLCLLLSTCAGGGELQEPCLTSLCSLSAYPLPCLQAKEMLAEAGVKGQTNVVGAACIAGFCAAFCSLPFDFIKTRIQVGSNAAGHLPASLLTTTCFLERWQRALSDG